jgi:radical SAM protein with 4Fe4S-binding SPASM domain
MENSRIKNPSENEVDDEMVCPALGNVLMVDSLGNITICCYDESLKNEIGNLKDMDLYEALNSKKLNGWINAQKNQNINEMAPLCKDCIFYKEYLKK